MFNFIKKNRKKNKEPFDRDRLMAEIMYRVRGMFLDSQLEEAFALSVIAGASYVSDDIAEKEREDSDKRVERISFLLPMITTHAFQLSKATTELLKTKMKDEEVPEDYFKFYQERSQSLMMSCAIGSIAQMVDIGLLELGPLARNRK